MKNQLAFPIPLNHTETWNEEKNQSTCDGMLLRDYFAALAMAGLIAEPFDKVTENFLTVFSDKEKSLEDNVALAAYRIADAMLKEREK